MGEACFLGLINATPYDWERTYCHSYQMESWDSSFPQTIGAGTADQVYIEFATWEVGNPGDDGAEVTYQLRATPPLQFQIQARTSPGRHLQVLFENFQTSGNPQGSILDLGWNHNDLSWNPLGGAPLMDSLGNGIVNFILSGRAGNLHSSYPPDSSKPPASWMQDNLGTLGNRTIRQLCMPGSHDAGMSTFGDHTFFANPGNTLTQTQGIYGQLIQGARYFDIRPVISAGIFKTGHFSYVSQASSSQGACGQVIKDIIDDINRFTSSHSELVILKVGADQDTDAGPHYPAFSQQQWNSLLQELQAINGLYIHSGPVPGDTTLKDYDLSQLTLGSYIGNGRPAVIVIVAPSDPKISLGDEFFFKGFYTLTNLPVYDQYANMDNLGAMAQDQLNKLVAQRTSPNDQCFLFSWTLTQQDVEAFLGFPPILRFADWINPWIGINLWPKISKQRFPNILYTDNVNSRDFNHINVSPTTALAIAINDFTMPA